MYALTQSKSAFEWPQKCRKLDGERRLQGLLRLSAPRGDDVGVLLGSQGIIKWSNEWRMEYTASLPSFIQTVTRLNEDEERREEDEETLEISGIDTRSWVRPCWLQHF